MQGNYCVFNRTGESFVGLSVLRADTALTRLSALLRRGRMKSGEGLWVASSRGLHTVGMRAPVDLMYLDAHNRVIHLVEHLSSLRIGPILWDSTSVLLLPPHTIYSSQTHVGDQLLICPPDEMEAWLKKAAPGFGAPGQDGKAP
jgi:uncharacterized protein